MRALLGNATGPVDVLFMTEDRAALNAFRHAAPDTWAVHVHEPAIMGTGRFAPAAKGRNNQDAGWNSVVALVVAMQAGGRVQDRRADAAGSSR